MDTKRQECAAGDVVTIPLKSGRYAFGQVLDKPLMAFFDYEALEQVPTEILETLRERPVAFKVWVMNHAVKTGRWKVIGKLDKCGASGEKPAFFKQDAISGALTITTDGSDEIPATREQCEPLERAAVWEPSHVEDRLADHFESKTNKWVESLRLR